jgi:hypothetical protein
VVVSNDSSVVKQVVVSNDSSVVEVGVCDREAIDLFV